MKIDGLIFMHLTFMKSFYILTTLYSLFLVDNIVIYLSLVIIGKFELTAVTVQLLIDSIYYYIAGSKLLLNKQKILFII